MKRIIKIFVVAVVMVTFAIPAMSKPPKSKSVKSKFYDFSGQLIDGEIKRPTALYADARQKAKFDRLLDLKKQFLEAMYRTSKEKVFK